MSRGNDTPFSTSDAELVESGTVLVESTPSIEALQGEEQREVLNLIDSLRQCGLDEIVSLPQLVVCGDQSSGKSSVLEGTRFATELVLRRAITPRIETKIIADASRSAAMKQKLAEFQMSITDFSELPYIIDKATEAMGLGNNSVVQAFSKDVLRIEISGPNRPQLTLVDLPGLIHSSTKSQSKEDIQVVSDLVQRYIENSRTIILAIVSAKNDYANQTILDKARAVDKDGHRTLGIITKPDDLQENSENLDAYLNLAKNDDIFFSLGWHVVKNRNFTEALYSFEQRNQSEREFFSQGRWAELDPDMLGIDTLRRRLSKLLFQHIQQELPKLYEDLNSKHHQTCLKLNKLGSPRATEHQQREYLLKIAAEFNGLTKAAIDGHYEHSFFRHGNMDFKIEQPIKVHPRRLRATIQNSNHKFTELMHNSGHKYKFQGFAQLIDNEFKDQEPDGFLAGDPVEGASNKKQPKKIPSVASETKILSKENSLNWVRKVLICTRGTELSGNFNPTVIGELFWEQSEKWHDLAQDHGEAVSELCKSFVRDLLKQTCPAEVYERLYTNTIDKILDQRSEAAQKELKKIVNDNKRHPATWNHYYTDTITKIRRDNDENSLKRAVEGATTKTPITTGKDNQVVGKSVTINISQAIQEFQGKIEQDMEKHTCQEALICVRAYYKISLKTFIDNINTQVIERHIVQELEKVFSPLTVAKWTAEEISGLASEPSAIIRQREHLENKRVAIEDGLKVFRSMMRRG